jgi:hypothetical protein
MSMSSEVDLREIPEGDWVVLSSDESRILAHHRDLETALAQAEARGERDVVFFKAEGVGKFLIGSI